MSGYNGIYVYKDVYGQYFWLQGGLCGYKATYSWEVFSKCVLKAVLMGGFYIEEAV